MHFVRAHKCVNRCSKRGEQTSDEKKSIGVHGAEL
jgi:hypothetical protein